ncbi:hypothetical protein AAHH79_41050, partial [Burkholderia pseudomallei]
MWIHMYAPAPGEEGSVVGDICRAAFRVESAPQADVFSVLHRSLRVYDDKSNRGRSHFEVADQAQA